MSDHCHCHLSLTTKEITTKIEFQFELLGIFFVAPQLVSKERRRHEGKEEKTNMKAAVYS